MSPLYSVMVVTLVVWVGLFLYLWRLDARVKETERRLAGGSAAAVAEAPEAVIETQGGAR
ncbi:MAG: CcmD family protein [Armatimonadetes bacterium]|nr:CcmD family protein [Armatimonadota bacterium]